MRLPLLSPSVVLLVLSSITPIRCTIDLDFSAYPTSTQTCLEDAAGISGCAGDTVAEMNQCLCGNTGNFVLNTATCIGAQGTDILEKVWELLQESCSNTKTPLGVSEAKFLDSGTKTVVTSTITTTSAGVLTTFTTTSTSTHISSSTTATATSTASSATTNTDEVVTSARVGAITASVAGTLFIVCVVCLIILLRKRKRDKELLRRAQAAVRDRGGPDKPLLNPGDITPGFLSPANSGYDRTLAANVAPPTPSYAGPISPHAWRSWPQAPSPGTTTTPSELDGDHPQHEDLPHGPHTYWPSPLSQGAATMGGTWCPSPLSAVPSSNVLGMYNGGTSTVGAHSTVSSPLSRQITGTMSTSRSSWAHNRPQPDELYELPGSEVRSPVEADSIPVLGIPNRASMAVSQAPPPEYSAGGWNDPITDKPPAWI